jgi:DNA-binding Xre family transcriptional regulator
MTTNFAWRLRALMDEHHLEETSALRPLLAARGIELSREQVYRLVTHPPERLSMATLVALCDIFNCQPSDLIELQTVSPSRRTRKTEPAKTAGKARVSSTRVKLR